MGCLPRRTVNASTLTNGLGSINIDVLRRGQYAFAKGTGAIGIAETADTRESWCCIRCPCAMR